MKRSLWMDRGSYALASALAFCVAMLQEASAVLVAGDGELYEGPLVVAAGIHVLGGWAPGTFEPDEAARPTVVTTGTQEMSQVVGLSARGIAARTLIARLNVRTAGPAHTHIGAVLEDSPVLELSHVEILAGPGANGTSGESGTAGTPGGGGGDGNLAMDFGAGGVNDRCDRALRQGGDGGIGGARTGQGTTPARSGQDAGSGASGGDAGSSGVVGRDGQDGETGLGGEDGGIPSLGAFDRAQWVVEQGEEGTPGQPGQGGGGGGGGAEQSGIERGGAGGGGGAGGCAGTGGQPGTPAGSSFGALIITAPRPSSTASGSWRPMAATVVCLAPEVPEALEVWAVWEEERASPRQETEAQEVTEAMEARARLALRDTASPRTAWAGGTTSRAPRSSTESPEHGQPEHRHPRMPWPRNQPFAGTDHRPTPWAYRTMGGRLEAS